MNLKTMEETKEHPGKRFFEINRKLERKKAQEKFFTRMAQHIDIREERIFTEEKIANMIILRKLKEERINTLNQIN